jgi:UDP-glucose 4-epimerase
VALVLTDSDPLSGKKGDLALVTGASGFIGSALCAELLKQGFRVRAFLRPKSAPTHLPKGVEIYRSELSDQAGLDQACVDIDSVFHLAGIAHVSAGNAELHKKVTVEGTANLLQSARRTEVRRFIFFSSILAAALDNPGTPERNKTHYAITRHQAEQLVLNDGDGKLETCVLRPANVYGPGMKGNIAGMIRRIRDHQLPPLPNLNNEMYLVSVQDLCEVAILAARNSKSVGQTYVVTDGMSYTPSSLERDIYEALGRNKPAWHSPRFLYYLASLAAHMLDKSGVWKNGLGLRAYNNLVESRVLSRGKTPEELGYQPTRRFANELPAIIAKL